MAWDQLGTSAPHVAYATTGFALLLFGTISLFIKEKLYIGEATVSTVYGLIVGPHCLDWFSPTKWGNSDYITLELSRIVLVVQIFAVAVELPKKYMLKHWLSVFYLLLPVMAYGWLIGSVFIWKLVPTLRWIEALAIAGCVTATDPVLASAVVGKGKFAKRVPGHLRNILSAESGCNDGMAFPFVFMALNIISHEHHPREIAKDFLCISVLYECIFGCVVGAVIGYAGRHLIKFAEKMNLIDRESFLAYYFCMALFCAGVGTVIGVDDLLVAFSAGTAFAWDGWFAKKTEKSEVSNVIDLLVNSAYFIYFGAIIPWEKFNDAGLGIRAWKLVVLAIVMFIARRLPVILALKPLIPDIKTWREAAFCGHFGPIGVGGLFMAILARADLEGGKTTPLKDLPDTGSPHYYIISTIWPITCFLVLASIIVHGSSIALFTLGKRINNISITMSYTTGGNGPSWLSRLPERMKGDMHGSGSILRLEKIDTEYSPKTSASGSTGRKSSAVSSGNLSRRNGERPARDSDQVPMSLSLNLKDRDNKIEHIQENTIVNKEDLHGTDPRDLTGYQEGSHILFEDSSGDVVKNFDLGVHGAEIEGTPKLEVSETKDDLTVNGSDSSDAGEKTANADGADSSDAASGVTTAHSSALHLPNRGEQVFAYQLDDNVIVENCDGEIIRRYKIHRRGCDPDSTLTGRLSRFLGFSKKKKATGTEDVEKTPADHMAPVGDEPELTPGEEQQIEGQIEGMLGTGELERCDTEEAVEKHRANRTIHNMENRLHKGAHDVAHKVAPRDGLLAGTGRDIRHRLEGFMNNNRTEDGSKAPIPECTKEEYDAFHAKKDAEKRAAARASSHASPPSHAAGIPGSSGVDEETEVERKRRLAALGQSATPSAAASSAPAARADPLKQVKPHDGLLEGTSRDVRHRLQGILNKDGQNEGGKIPECTKEDFDRFHAKKAAEKEAQARAAAQSQSRAVHNDDIPFQGGDDDEEETEVERNRRLAALGVLGTGSRDDSPPPQQRSASRHIGTIPEAEENPNEPKLTFDAPK